MDPAPRHTRIVQTLETPWGTLVREDYFQYPILESNLYMVDPDGTGEPVWFAERAMDDDAYANPVQQVNEYIVRCGSWNGFDCEISLLNGNLLSASFTK